MRAAHIGHEVIVFHVLTRDEVELPFRDDVEVEDAETGRLVLSNGAAAARPYREAISAFLERWRTRCATYGIDYVRVFTDTPLDAGLRALPAAPRPREPSAMIRRLAPGRSPALVLLAGPVLVHMLLRRNARRRRVSGDAVPRAPRARPRSGFGGRRTSGC